LYFKSLFFSGGIDEKFINKNHFKRNIQTGDLNFTSIKKEGINMAKKVAKVGVKKEKGYLYFVDKKGNVARAKMARGKKKGKAKIQVVEKVGVKKESGMLYFIDKQGDVSCAVMARGGRKKKAAKKKKR